LKNLITIGSIDKLDLKEFGFEDVDCKIDTGADSSSIHCTHVKLIERNEVELLSFRLFDHKHPNYEAQTITVNNFSEKKIKSSNGISELRFVIKTKVKLFNKIFPINFSLSDRSNMTYPILLGRKFLNKRFLVDVSKKNLSFNQKSK
jgi:hypothetical protein